MNTMLVALGVILAGSLWSLLSRRAPRALRLAGPGAMIAGCILGVIPASRVVISGTSCNLRWPWSLPFGSLSLCLDPLSAFFAVPILLICALATLYGIGYLKPYEGQRDVGLQWFFFGLLAASMVVVVLARNAILFLLAWEIMALTSFFLVLFDSERKEVRHAGWIYLVATHIGTAFLLVLFMVLGKHAGSLDFDRFDLRYAPHAVTTAAFLLAVIGFGTKAGFIPLHVWLPEAHPAAPSHVSAVMSGVMIKTGIYGLVRILTFLGPPPAWWGWLLVLIGMISGILGILFALAQHDLKRMLAYSSVENIGIITLGMGLGVLGIAYGHPAMIFLGFAGSFLHVFNHALFKSLLFFSAGSVLHATGTREIDRLGGLLKKMPATAFAFIVGSMAICGLPPLNGFVSEFLIYVGALTGAIGAAPVTTATSTAGLLVAVSLALIGGLAVACFTKAFGVVFLGEGRSAHVAHAHEAGVAMRIPMALLAVFCLLLGLAGPLLPALLLPVVQGVLPAASFDATQSLAVRSTSISGLLGSITLAAVMLLALAIALALLRRGLLAGRPATQAVTWDCSFAQPTPRMQYTSSSFAAPITNLFRLFLGTRRTFHPPQGLFPKDASFASEARDFYHERIYQPFFSAIEGGLARLRWMQHGRLNLYILSIVIALIALLAWKLRS